MQIFKLKATISEEDSSLWIAWKLQEQQQLGGSLLSNNFNVDRYVRKDQTRRAFGWLTRSRHVDGSIRNKVYKNEAANAQKTNPEIKRERERHTHRGGWPTMGQTKKMMIALSLVLFIISSSHSVNAQASASDCYRSCQTHCIGGPPRVPVKPGMAAACDRNCASQCGLDLQAKGHHK
ncbi:uncharacterized protein LOC127801876 isoform X3 [Diospyros lotus]|uniref:uncharacterized protein LOC127801876 isoform X3 n=1 Tax=Diospyros lotus TaxID=55363 RepID=UPI00224DC1F6|nr:uncharacterized protein LOC127801876 isoform X3 [Diospyros lotus]XP_052193332.1 uncharacterized protein LOC127801876 isoform X3 [Diospyros lotus]